MVSSSQCQPTCTWLSQRPGTVNATPCEVLALKQEYDVQGLTDIGIPLAQESKHESGDPS